MTKRTLNVLALLALFAAAGCDDKKSAPAATATTTSASTEAAAPAAAAAEAPRKWAAGDEVDVEWNGDWFQAKVLEVSGDGAELEIHYEGYGSKWDETVPLSRVRPRTADAKRGNEE